MMLGGRSTTSSSLPSSVVVKMQQASRTLLLCLLCLLLCWQTHVTDAQLIIPLPGGSLPPTASPVEGATVPPTATPVAAATNAPTAVPATLAPTTSPVAAATNAPTAVPATLVPTTSPIAAATNAPTAVPATLAPTTSPIAAATNAPTAVPVPATLAPTAPLPTTAAPTAPLPTTAAPTGPLPTTVAPTPAVAVPATASPTVAGTLAPTVVTDGTESPVTNATIAPTPISSKYPFCNVCGDGKQVGNPDGLTLDGTITCEKLDALGASGDLEPVQCSKVQERIQEDCACSTSGEPEGEPIEGQVVMTLFSVPSQMSPEITQQWEDALVQFYTENPPDTTRNYTDWSARIISQNQVTEETDARRYRRLRRHLQEDNFPLLTRTVMSALVQGDTQEQADFEESLRETLDANNETFTGLLTTANAEYFASVETVETSDPTAVETPAPEVNATTTAPTAAPAPAPAPDSGGLSTGAIVGIVIGVLVVIIIAVVVIKKSSGTGEATAAAAAGAARATDEEQPRASAKAVAVADASTMEKQSSSMGMTSKPKSKRKMHTVTREIVAPPGKLGLVLDTMEGRGPVVHRVHIDSPMAGKIFIRDVIVAVSGVDTRSMNATHVTKLMQDTAETERILRIEREEPMTETELAAAAADAAALMGASVAAAAASSKSPPPVVLVEITAPKGKLGIILDTVEGKGPIVHRVHSESPLKGKVFEGDIIVTINGIDTRPMDATKITAIMIETAENERQLVVERVDKS